MIHILILPLLFSNTIATPLIGDKTADIKPALENEFPFVVSIGLAAGGREHICTGTLITRSHVLTAAHCSHHFGRLRNVRVLVGTNDLNNPDGKGKAHHLTADGWTNFDDWARETNHTHQSPYHWNDIAIITLLSEVDERIPLPKFSHHTDDQLYGRTAVTAGWGDMKNDVKPNLMQKSPLHLMSRDECKDNMADLGYKRYDVNDNELCSNADPQVILGWGDSGGPLLIDGNKIIGVNEGMCPSKVTPIPANAFNLHISLTDYYRQFIKSVTGRCAL